MSSLPHLPVRALLVPVVRKVSSKKVAAHGVEVSLLPIIGGIGALPRALLSSSKECIPVFHSFFLFIVQYLKLSEETETWGKFLVKFSAYKSCYM